MITPQDLEKKQWPPRFIAEIKRMPFQVSAKVQDCTCMPRPSLSSSPWIMLPPASPKASKNKGSASSEGMDWQNMPFGRNGVWKIQQLQRTRKMSGDLEKIRKKTKPTWKLSFHLLFLCIYTIWDRLGYESSLVSRCSKGNNSETPQPVQGKWLKFSFHLLLS